VPHLFNHKNYTRKAALSVVLCTTVLLSSCMQISNPLSNDTKVAEKQVGEAREAVKKAHKEEEKEFKKERREEKAEDRDFAKMKRELEADRARAAAQPGQTNGKSREFVDKELLALNQRVHHLSQRMEHLSDRVHKLAEHMENLTTKLAELKLELVTTEDKVQKMAAAPKSEKAGSTKKGPPKKLARNTPPAKKVKPFWSVQLGAYKTKPGAEEAWGDILANPMAVELSEAKVHYIPTKPLKNGKRLTLIVINKYANRKSADAACKAMIGNGIDCVAHYARP